MTIGGAGTGTPPLDVLVSPPLEVDVLVLLDVLVVLPPKLDEVLVEVETFPLELDEVEVEVET